MLLRPSYRDMAVGATKATKRCGLQWKGTCIICNAAEVPARIFYWLRNRKQDA